MDAEVSTHTFLTMIIEESVCFMSCEPIFICNYYYVVHGIYFYFKFHCSQVSVNLYPTFFSSTEQCAWAIISPKELKSWVTRISFALLSGKTELCCQIFCDLLLKSAFERIVNVMQLILVNIKWHIKSENIQSKISTTFAFHVTLIINENHDLPPTLR
jgi:hypothetical protein